MHRLKWKVTWLTWQFNVKILHFLMHTHRQRVRLLWLELYIIYTDINDLYFSARRTFLIIRNSLFNSQILITSTSLIHRLPLVYTCGIVVLYISTNMWDIQDKRTVCSYSDVNHLTLLCIFGALRFFVALEPYLLNQNFWHSRIIFLTINTLANRHIVMQLDAGEVFNIKQLSQIV